MRATIAEPTKLFIPACISQPDPPVADCVTPIAGRDFQALEDDMKLSRITALTTVSAALALGAIASTPTFAEMKNEKTVTGGGAPMYPSKNIIQNPVNSTDHTTLVAAVKAAGLVDQLSGAGPFN